MIRPILEFLVERSLDEGRQPPVWLRWLSRRHPSLRNYSENALQLDGLLRSSALARREQLAEGTAFVLPRVAGRRYSDARRPVVQLAWLAAAASVLVAGVILFDRHLEREAKAQQVQLVSAQLAAVPGEVLALFSDVAQVPQVFSPLERVKLPPVDPWSDIPRGTQGQLKRSFGEWGSQLSDLGEQVRERLMIVKL